MDVSKSKGLLSKVLYWVGSLLVILALFVLIFGVVGVFIADNHLKAHKVFGLLIGLVGAAMFLIGVRNPFVLWKRVLKKDADEAQQGDPFAASLFAGILGLGLFIGGLTYGHTGEILYLILSFAVPAVLIRLLFKRPE